MPTPRELLGPNGPFARLMAGYEHRAGQLDMADAVDRALREDRILLCEAGTGTGKTLAYLVPALLLRRTVVVSTGTKALQEQIFFKDLPLIERHLGPARASVLVKGLANYVCIRRLREFRVAQQLELGMGAVHKAGRKRVGRPAKGKLALGDDAHMPTMLQALARVESWAAQSESGDIAEAVGLTEDHPIWPEITSSSDTRLGPQCPYFEDCFVTRLKRKAERAQLLVVNHHLLFADLAVKGDHPGGVLPGYDAVILDEAHKIEDIATSFFGAQLSSSGLDRLLGDAERALRQSGQHAAALEPPRLVAQARGDAQALFAELERRAFGSSRRGLRSASDEPPDGVSGARASAGENREALGANFWVGELQEAYHRLDETLEALAGQTATGPADEGLRAMALRLEALRQTLGRIVAPDRAAVSWCERRARSMAVAASPIDIGPILHERLFDRGMAAVLTSASLSTAGSFEFVRSRLGLEQSLAAPIDELVVSSALDHERAALLYTPTDLPEVNDADFTVRAIARIVELIDISGGGAFVLCTSVRSMNAIASALGRELRQPLLVQGSAPKRALLERFRAEHDAVLVATMSFWEGVDVPGQALRLVIIDRIPFAVPSDPVVAARCRALEETGKQPFKSYMLPQAAITLKQGFGRLLRTRKDWGVVAILDRRICARGYGRGLISSLPPVPQTTELEDVAAFWHGHELHDS